MARLIAALIRHGEYRQIPQAPSAHQPFPLVAEGVEQARAGGQRVCEQIKAEGWHLLPEVDSSQMLRAWQTAQLVIQELAGLSEESLSIVSFDALAERGVGAAANLTQDQILSVLQQDPRYADPPADWKSNSHYRLPLQGAESLLQAGQRVADHLLSRMQALEEQVEEDSLKLFVGHGAAFRHAAHHLGVLEFDQIARLSMYHVSPVYLEYLGGGSWAHIAGEWKIRDKESRYLD